MSYIAVVYESNTGNVEMMAKAVSEGIAGTGYESKLYSIADVTNNDLLNADGIIVGSYTSYGIVAGSTKSFFDRTFRIHGKLQNKIGAAFSSSGGLGGGNETTVMSIIQMLLVHGMIVLGDSESPHFGAVAVGKPTDDDLQACQRLGRRVAEIARNMTGQC